MCEARRWWLAGSFLLDRDEMADLRTTDSPAVIASRATPLAVHGAPERATARRTTRLPDVALNGRQTDRCERAPASMAYDPVGIGHDGVDGTFRHTLLAVVARVGVDLEQA